jgi:competence protein ComEC
LATYGLIALSPWLEEKLAFIPKTLMLRDSAVATIAAQIMVAPLILYYIGDFSFVSIVVNMLVLFMVPISMLLGFVVAVMSSFTPFIATLLAVPLSISLSYILWIVEFFADIPFAKISINMFSWWWLIPWYLFIFYLVHKDLKN